jgi:short subunit fatty acids transporter
MHDDRHGGHEPVEQPLVSDAYRAGGGSPAVHDDGNATLAIAAGLVAALVAGAVWALIVLKTGYEIGWVAWGIGLAVGLVMSRLTASRSSGLAFAAAGFAAVGLLTGKLMITTMGAGAIAGAIVEDEDFLTEATIYYMIDEGGFSEETQAAYDAIAEGDTLPVALTDQMVAQAQTRVATMSEDERHGVARWYAESAIGSMGLSDRIMSQMSGWDLLWFFLAISTAYGMMKPSEPEGAAAV